MFRFDAETSLWLEVQELLASEGADQAGAGRAVAMHGDAILIGADGDMAGSARVFDLDCTDECPTDLDGDGVTGVDDLAFLITGWNGRSSDTDGDGVTGVDDLMDMILAWGPCVDCNANGVPDADEIAGGTSFDCNANGVPDDCEGDCNANGVLDSCDLVGGASSDCNTAPPTACRTHATWPPARAPTATATGRRMNATPPSGSWRSRGRFRPSATASCRATRSSRRQRHWAM
ncbi:MAG: FG-GAP repeat protein [Planctomycetota bacterium]